MESRDRVRGGKSRAMVGEEAAEWLTRLQSGDSHAVRAELVDWLRTSPVHVAEFLRVSQVHGALREFSRWAEVPGIETGGNVVMESESLDVKEPKRPWPWFSAVAATACAATIAVAWLTGMFSWRAIETDTADRREVALADGSVVDMSPETRLSARFSEGERRVVLVHGDALFRVAKDETRAFVVEAGRARVRAVGTAFGVQRRRDDSVVVTVAEGRVAVSRDDGSAFARAFGEALEEIAVIAGEQIEVPEVGEISRVREVDTGRALAWAEGKLIFEDDDLSEVVRQFNRHNIVQIRLADERLAARTISGVFNAADPESFVAFLETDARVKVDRDNSREFVIRNAEHTQREVQ